MFGQRSAANARRYTYLDRAYTIISKSDGAAAVFVVGSLYEFSGSAAASASSLAKYLGKLILKQHIIGLCVCVCIVLPFRTIRIYANGNGFYEYTRDLAFIYTIILVKLYHIQSACI